MLAHLHHSNTSPTAVICENLQRFGGAPARGEPDPRAIWDETEALAGLDNVLDIIVDEIAPDGTQFADERESLLWGFVNTLHMQAKRLDRAVDKLSPKLKDLQAAQDGTEINAWELERTIERARHLGDRRDAFECLRDSAAERYREDTGHTWRPRSGSHTSRTSKLTSAAIDARDFLRAREQSKTQAHLPEGTLVAVAGSGDVEDAGPIHFALDRVRAKYPDMVLVYVGYTALQPSAVHGSRHRPPFYWHNTYTLSRFHTHQPSRIRPNTYSCVDFSVDRKFQFAILFPMKTRKRMAKVRLTLTKRSVDALSPARRPWIAWDDKLTGFGIRVQPSGTKSFLINYRADGGGRYSPNRRLVIGRYGRITVEQARRQAQALLGRVAAGEDPAAQRAQARGLPTLGEALEEYIGVNPNRSDRTNELYRQNLRVHLPDWVNRPLNTISRKDVETRFHLITKKHGWAGANQTMSMLRSVYRRPCVDHEGLRNPVELWLAAGGRFNRHRRRKISAPAEVLPRWCKGIRTVTMSEAIRDILWIGVYTGMRLDEVRSLRWERIDLERLILRVDETKTGEVLELPITRQLAAIFERRRTQAKSASPGKPLTGFLFPSDWSRTGHIVDVQPVYAPITRAGGAKFWFHGLRNSFISVAERELMLPRSLTKRLVNHARSHDVTEGYAADWTVEQLREPAQRVADRIDVLRNAELAHSVSVSPSTSRTR